MPDIAKLLTDSRAAHERFKQHSPRMVPNGTGGVTPSSGDPIEATRALGEAATLRRSAHDADPQHHDPAWAAEPVPHADLMAYYKAMGQ